MATVAECEEALELLAERFAGSDSSTGRTAEFERTLSCTLTDLRVYFTGRIGAGRLSDISRGDGVPQGQRAQIRLRMTSDDLLLLVAGQLHLATAWASGRVRIDASVLDLLRLRSMF